MPFFFDVAEGERFELSIPCGMPPFQDGALGLYATLPCNSVLQYKLFLSSFQINAGVYIDEF